MKSFYFALIICVCCVSTANAQSAGSSLANDDVVKKPEMTLSSNLRKNIRIPDIMGYYTMKCDFHTHTIFSDGEVYPVERVKEAWQHGLDAIAITDHLEYRPRNTINADHNESYRIAKQKGDEFGMLVIKGAEITRRKPFGHLNALFITDANPLAIPDSMKAVEIAIAQGGFILWNHPGWPDNKSTLYPVHEQMIKENKIHGVEVSNGTEYYPVSFDWCKNMNLAFVGNSDIHPTISGSYGNKLRPMTLVFASERSNDGIRNALFARRSVAFCNGMLVGPKEYLLALLAASLEIKVIDKEKRRSMVTNKSDIEYRIQDGEYLFVLPAGKTAHVKLPSRMDVVVLNCFTGLNENLKISIAEINSFAGLR